MEFVVNLTNILCSFLKMQQSFYNSTAAFRDPDLQIHGAIGVIYALGHTSIGHGNPFNQWNATKLLSAAVPIRIEAIHVCHDSLVRKMMVAVVKAALGAFVKTRSRTHYGKHLAKQLDLTLATIRSPSIGHSLTNVFSLQALMMRFLQVFRASELHRVTFPFQQRAR